MTTPPSSWARWSAKADLPLAVGPAMTTAFKPGLSTADASPIVRPAMESVLTLIAGDSAGLPPDLIATLTARFRDAGARTGDLAWLAPANRAGDLPFDGLAPEKALAIARATLADLPVDFHAQPQAGRRKKLLIA